MQVTTPKAITWSEMDSEWVAFPNGKQYLLPVVSRDGKYTPIFQEDGTISLEVKKVDTEVDELLGQFLNLFSTYQPEQWSWTTDMVAVFLRLVRHLLLRNYLLSASELSGLLTMDAKQLGSLVTSIFNHLRRA